MIGKHVDLIAIALLLILMAVCRQARNAALLRLHSTRTVWITPQGSRIFVPAVPRISFSRD